MKEVVEQECQCEQCRNARALASAVRGIKNEMPAVEYEKRGCSKN